MPTSASLTDDLMAQLQGAPMQGLAQQLGLSMPQAEQAVGQALPVLMGTLGRNAEQPQGAADLLGALQRDHSGAGPDLGGLLAGVLGAGSGGAGAMGGLGGLGSLLGGGASEPAGGAHGGADGGADGAAILGHIFGGSQERATQGLGQATGLGNQAGDLLQMLAPIVMAFLAQRVQSGGLDAGGLGQVLGQERGQLQNGAAGGLLGQLLDQDGDGQLGLGDLLQLGGGLLGRR